ncbi:MAG: DMT family transporter [Bacteroidaceae bacterium]|nr:DMT family transporter [Bacteroidaceae bacterium]
MKKNNAVSIFQHSVWVVVFALTAAVAWGWAYPLIKLGFEAFSITSDMTGSKMLFAGIRFALSGLIVLAFARGAHRRLTVSGMGGWLYVLTFSLMNTTLHYACFYIGLSHSAGARAAVFNSLGVFMLVLLACAFFKTDRLSMRKVVGCAVGFAGVVVLNFGGGESGQFTLLGDGMIILNALCSAVAGLMTRGLGRYTDVFVGTGYSLAIGGVLLVIPGLLMGGTLPQVTGTGLLILFLLIAISTIGFTLYNKLLSCNPVGKVAIFNSLIPVVGAVTSCLCLHEPFYIKYVLAVLLSAGGIYIINRGKK